MHIRLDKLGVGKWRYLSEVEMKMLQESVVDSSATPEKLKSPDKHAKPVKKSVKKNEIGINKKSFHSKDRKVEKKVKDGFKKQDKESSRKTRSEKAPDKSFKAFRNRGRKK
jgi:23S rRNA pseudouridine2604 synthase